jgi:hypothetical protein
MVVAASRFDLLQTATTVHGRDRGHRSPEVCEMTTTHQFASSFEKPLAKRGKSSDPGH